MKIALTREQFLVTDIQIMSRNGERLADNTPRYGQILFSGMNSIPRGRGTGAAPYCTKCTVGFDASLTRPLAKKKSHPKRLFDAT